nr:NB-ARC domain-containing protein [uncultured Cohaesibacter sp.]
MSFLPIKKMLERVSHNATESDTTRFWELTYAGEFLIRLTAATLVACVDRSPDRDRYGLEYKLVRADGIGDWVQAIEQVLTGPPASHLNPFAYELRNSLTKRDKVDSERSEAINLLVDVLKNVYNPEFEIRETPSFRLWLKLFVTIRNKSRGHGAQTPAKLSSCVESLEKSIDIYINSIRLDDFEWAYLHRNLSGKYRVIGISDNCGSFDFLKTSKAQDSKNFQSGCYIWLSEPRRVNLIYTDQDCLDFFFPNGDFKLNDFELHSLISDNRRRQSNTDFMNPIASLPRSETEGLSSLEAIGNVLTNIPERPRLYIARKKLEVEVYKLLENDRHPIITLVGRGGIGKTSLTLKVLHELTLNNRFDIIVWFSARDIDLTTSGAKTVRPSILTEKEISKQFFELMGKKQNGSSGKFVSEIDYMTSQMGCGETGPILFVFDNFETLRNPQDIFAWIDASIRLPNKALITSRFRDFKGDYPIEISGMGRSEADELITVTSRNLSVEGLLQSRDRNAIIEESEGHPYIIKILIGEIADTGAYTRPSRIMARRDDILVALFERTFGALSPLAARTFMMLSQWRSTVPQLLVEAVLLRHAAEEAIDPETAINQLVRTSLIERSQDPEGSDHLLVPLSASIFGQSKLQVSASRMLILDDVKFLQSLGASDQRKDEKGIFPRLKNLFSSFAKRIEHNETSLAESRSVLEFIARGYADAWLLLSRLEIDCGEDGWQENAAEYLRRYLQNEPNGSNAYEAWQELQGLYMRQGDVVAGCGAFLRMAEFSEPPLESISSMANWLNSTFKTNHNLTIDQRSAVFLPLAELMKKRLVHASATDFSRLGWLFLNCGDKESAKHYALEGLKRDAGNTHCARIIERLEER